jgi:hypothetical protein
MFCLVEGNSLGSSTARLRGYHATVTKSAAVIGAWLPNTANATNAVPPEPAAS